MQLMALLSMIISIMYFVSSHPVTLMGLILTQALMTCGLAWVSLKTSWFSYILFLIFLGGLMVLFIYITSLASNEMIKLKPLTLFTSLSIFVVVMGWLASFASEHNSSPIILSTGYLVQLYSTHIMTLTTGVLLYLLLTLVVVVKITSKFDAPVKNFIY